MLISWITKFSLIDYPWQVSCIVFTPGCNFRCGFCHNSEFVLPKKLLKIYKTLIPEKAVLNFLKNRKWLLTWVSICGWEPTMQQNLVTFCKQAKSLWFLVKLDTNGRDPKVVQELLDKKLVDYIAMDIKHEIWKFNILAGIKLDEKPYLETIKIIINSNIDYEFRTTVIKGIHTNETIKNIAKYISWAKAYYLQNYKTGRTLDPNFIWESFIERELIEFKKIGDKFIWKVWIRN